MYEFHTKPFGHQADVFPVLRARDGYALFWEQGCGKTKPVIDDVSADFLEGSIDSLVVVAPNGVHRNWITDEIPTHMPPAVRKRCRIILWESSKASTVGFKREIDAALADTGPTIFAVSYDGFKTEKAKAFFGKLFRRRRVLFVADEGHNIKTPGTATARLVVKASKYAAKRRLLTGTPVSTGPMDMYSQVRFLNPDFWKLRLGLGTFAEYKSHFGIWKQFETTAGQRFDKCVAFKNLDTLNQVLDEIGSRVTKDEVLDLPPKLYSKRYFDMTDTQRALYNQLKTEFVAKLTTGEFVEAPLAITQLLRLQQITSGYVGTGDENEIVEIEGPNRRMGVIEDIRDATFHPGIIWAKYTRDIDKITKVLGSSAVRYDGQVDDDGRARAKAAFQAGDAQWFVGNPQAGATGLTLVQARTVVYYNNSYKLVDRLQSEDRAHRIGQEHPVNYIDIVANGTVDNKIVDALRDKFDVATQITGDQIKEWI